MKFKILGKAFKIIHSWLPLPRDSNLIAPEWSLGMGIFNFLMLVFAGVSLLQQIVSPLKIKGRVLFTSICPDPGTQYEFQAEAHHPPMYLINSSRFDRVCSVGL